MVKVITYGSFDLLHYGHIRLLERAKMLGDYLIVGVTSDDYDKKRGKINLQQSLMERVEAVRATGIADEIVIEEYEGQKIDDIRKFNIDIFTVGSDWEGYFDYLKEYCEVVYLPRTDGVSSSDIRNRRCSINIGLFGEGKFLNKVFRETKYVNGIRVVALCLDPSDFFEKKEIGNRFLITENYSDFLSKVDAVYVRSQPKDHYQHIKMALNQGKHVLCESPFTIKKNECEELLKLAKDNNLILMEAIKTAYSTAFARLLLLIKGGLIGQVISVDSVCTSMRVNRDVKEWNCVHEWGPTALLPVFQILGVEYLTCSIVSQFDDSKRDVFSKIDFVYQHAVASIKIGEGVKSEGELIVTGTKGYIYVPAPWWKTDYFEVRYEDPSQNKRYFYQLDGEGIRYELVAFSKAVQTGKLRLDINRDVSLKITEVMEQFEARKNMFFI